MKHRFWQRSANFLRRFPWITAGLYRIWRVFQSRYTIGVVGVLFAPDGRVLLVEHVFHPKHPWGLPGGWVNRREDPAVAVEREFMEELSLTVEASTVLLAEFHHGNHLDMAYLCTSSGEIGTLSYELLAYDWFERDNLPSLHEFHRNALDCAFEITQSHGKPL